MQHRHPDTDWEHAIVDFDPHRDAHTEHDHIAWSEPVEQFAATVDAIVEHANSPDVRDFLIERAQHDAAVIRDGLVSGQIYGIDTPNIRGIIRVSRPSDDIRRAREAFDAAKHQAHGGDD